MDKKLLETLKTWMAMFVVFKAACDPEIVKDVQAAERLERRYGKKKVLENFEKD